MKFLTALFAFASLSLASPLETAALEKRSSKSWAGTSLYFLHGLSFSSQDKYLDTLAADGVKVVRLWVSGLTNGQCIKGGLIANGCSDFETKLGEYNTYTLDLLDATLVKMAKRGMKALISPHNANLLSSKYGYKADVYGTAWGDGDFYTKPEAAKAYDNRLSAILKYKGAHSGKVWGQWHDAIMGFDIQNEAMLLDGKYQYNDPTGWVCARAAHMRSVLGGNNPIKVASGGVGGAYSNGANFASWVTSCPQLDIVSAHYYDDNGWADANFLGKAKGKLVHIEEWTTTQGSGQGSEYANEARQINALGIPWNLWQILPHQECSYSDSDPSGLVIDGGINVAGPIHDANNKVAAQDWSGIVY